jgi:hypothetical protein
MTERLINQLSPEPSIWTFSTFIFNMRSTIIRTAPWRLRLSKLASQSAKSCID